MEVVYHPEADAEEQKLPARERLALGIAVEKLEALGEKLGYPIAAPSRVSRNYGSSALGQEGVPGELSTVEYRT